MSGTPTPVKISSASLPAETHKCEKHGEYESLGMVILGRAMYSPCPDCEREEKAAEISARESKRSADRMAAADIPKRFAGKSFADYQIDGITQQKCFVVCKAYAKEFPLHKTEGRCLMLVGTAGTGKTHLATAILKEVLAQGFKAKYTTVYEAIGAIRDTWRHDSTERESAVVERFATADLLVLDEVGVQYGKESEQVELFKILNRRYNSVLPTIVISNCSLEDLERYLGARVYDRLRENDGKLLVFNWESQRGK